MVIGKHRGFLGLAIAGLFGFFSLGVSAAMIDDFGPADGFVFENESGGGMPSSIGLNATTGTILSGHRGMDAFVSGNDPLTISGSIENGIWTATSSGTLTATYGAVIMTYAYNAFELGTDGADRFWIDVIGISGDWKLLWNDDTSGGVWRDPKPTPIMNLNASSSGPQSILFSSLSFSGATRMYGIQIGVEGGSFDGFASFGYFCTGDVNGCISGVPAPAPIALLTLGLLGLRRLSSPGLFGRY